MTATMVDETASVVGAVDAGLRFEIHRGTIGVLRLDRPDRLNAIDWAMYQGLAHSVEALAARRDVLVLVVTGSERAFCAGGDIGFMQQMNDGIVPMSDVQGVALRLFNGLLELRQPTIAVVRGPAVGLGATLALACDMVFAGDDASIADPHVQIGLVPGDGGIVIWPLLVGPARAKEFLLTGDAVDAERAERLGLVNHVYPGAEVLDRALDLAARLAAGPAQTIQTTKVLANHVLRDLSERIVRSSLAAELASQQSDYHRRAVEQFLAGRLERF